MTDCTDSRPCTGRFATALALLAAFVLACGVGRALVLCDTHGERHVELGTASGCSHAHEVVVLCAHGCAHRVEGALHADACSKTEHEHGDHCHGNCLHRPLLVDIGAPPVDGGHLALALPTAAVGVGVTDPPQLTARLMHGSRDPPRLRSSTELRRTIQLRL